MRHSSCFSVLLVLWENGQDSSGGRLVATGNHCAVDVRYTPDVNYTSAGPVSQSVESRSEGAPSLCGYGYRYPSE